MKILQIAGFGKKFGSGHFVRQKILKNILTDIGYETVLLKIEKIDEIYKIDIKPFDIIIKDARESNEKLDLFFDDKCVITLDDFYIPQKYRGYRFFWNSIPSLKDFGNIKSLSYLLIRDFPESNFDSNCKKYDIIVNFGNLDPYNLSYKVAKILNKNFELIKDKSIVFVLPELVYKKITTKKHRTVFSNFDIIKVNNKDYYDKYYINIVLNSKTVITHYGLFLFESIRLKKNIILVSPTFYHEKLAKKYFNQFHVTEKKKINQKKLIDLIHANNTNDNLNFKIETSGTYCYDVNEKNRIKDFIHRILIFIKDNYLYFFNKCPVCDSKNAKIVYSSEKYHLLLCKNCKTIIKENVDQQFLNFDTKEKYYFDEYKNTYGKTYLEDRENIKKLNKLRIFNILSNLEDRENIKKLNKFRIFNILSNPKKRQKKNKEMVFNFYLIKAIDFGGALGFFLDDLKEELEKINKKLEGYIIETNSYAIDFCKNKGYKTFIKISDIDKELENSFDLISFWFCIEHIKEFNQIFINVKKLLKKGGLICLSFPSQFGPMFYFKKNRINYFKTRPEDHYYDFNPRSFSKLLKKQGFKIIKIRIPNFHYERFSKIFPFFSKIIGEKLYNFICGLIYFGDICEIYAIKM
ncbi:MAG: class I SAM-dependent methyltransferase [Exilispira sp.]